jgi:hypothetical protein
MCQRERLGNNYSTVVQMDGYELFIRKREGQRFGSPTAWVA